MTLEHNCGACSQTTGCAARKTDEKNAEEINAAPYLIFCAVVIVIASVVVRWLF
jgi:hypothetical protein